MTEVDVAVDETEVDVVSHAEATVTDVGAETEAVAMTVARDKTVVTVPTSRRHRVQTHRPQVTAATTRHRQPASALP